MRSIDLDMAALLSAAGGAAYDTGRDGRPTGDRRGGRLREVVADVAEDVLDLVAKEDHRDDDRDRDHRDDQCVLDQALPVVVTDELLKDHDLLLLPSVLRVRSI
jgi:hypothetical protein